MPDPDADLWMQAARAGDFATAWTISDRIRAKTTNRGDPTLPRHLQQIWDGTPVDGRRVLVRCYHGLGDTIQFARYLPALHTMAREVIVWVQPALLDLLATLPAAVTLLPLHDGAPEVAYDVDLEIMELPYVFRSTLETIPNAVPYLQAPSSLARDQRDQPRIGVVWRAGDWDDTRSIPFRQLQPLLASGHAEWCALQGERRREEQHADLQWCTGDTIVDTAAMIQQMDLVVSIDSMPAHLAGALGVPVWTLLPHRADWRWLTNRHDTPWYPTMRLFRQTQAGNWDDVIADVMQSVAARTLASHR
jgi:hypothetical protein